MSVERSETGLPAVHPDNPGLIKHKDQVTLDWVLTHELGQFGRFQLNTFLLIALPIIMSAFMSEFVFSAAAVPHRCHIPECGESESSHDYAPEWISNSVPIRNGVPASCERYTPIGHGSLTDCPAAIFNQSSTQGCDGYVYERTNSVVYEFDLGCKEWIRTLAGTLSSTGTLLVLPITGYVSDKYGRRIALIISVFNLSLIGVIRAFSVNYPMYLAFQLLQTTLGSGALSTSYVLAVELVGPKYRVATTAACSCMFALGQVVLTALAWLVPPWRRLTLVLFAPCFIVLVYYWILSESVRWLLSKEMFTEAKVVLDRIARVNKKQISEKSIQALLTPAPTKSQKVSGDLIYSIRQSPVLLRRVLTTPVWWITTTFVYYGISINSVGLAGNMYVNYMLISAIEIPGYCSAVFLLARLGRRATLSGGFFLSAACNVAFAFIDNNELKTLSLVLFLIGKFGISTVFTSLYLYTSELYPTQYRHTLLAFSSMIGRIGSIIAPLTPALMIYWDGIPSLMFGAMGLLSGCLVLTQPETLGTKMPDTLEEAEAIGKTKDNDN